MKIAAYLSFNGNCREAMLFYQKCLGGKLVFQTIGDSPLSEKMPQKMKDCILHATLKKGRMELLATDMVGENQYSTGTALSLMLECKTQTQIETIFNLLSEGGFKYHQLEQTFFGAIIGDLKDKFGIQWTLYLPQKKQDKNGRNI